MKYTVWYLTKADIWVNAFEAEDERAADEKALELQKEGKMVKIIPLGNPTP